MLFGFRAEIDGNTEFGVIAAEEFSSALMEVTFSLGATSVELLEFAEMLHDQYGDLALLTTGKF